jgi:hypothetical protein
MTLATGVMTWVMTDRMMTWVMTNRATENDIGDDSPDDDMDAASDQ